jgi:hypothetical protein
MTRRGALVLAATLAVACGKDEAKPYWDLKESFGEALTIAGSFAPYVDEKDVEKIPAWRLERSAYARTRISAAARMAREQYERKPNKPEATSPSGRVDTLLTDVVIGCKKKIAIIPAEHLKNDGDAIAACVHTLGRVDEALRSLDGEATKAGAPAGTIPLFGAKAPASLGDEIRALDRVAAVGPAEKKWLLLHDDANAAVEDLKTACDDAAKEAAQGIESAQSNLKDIYESKVLYAKGRKTLLMEADRTVQLVYAEIAVKPDRDKVCGRIRDLARIPEVPARYAAKLGELSASCTDKK